MAEYTVKRYIDPEKLSQDLAINEFNLDLSMMNQAGHFAYYAHLAAQAELQLSKFEQLEEIIVAQADKKIRNEAAVSGTKMTEAQVKAAIILEPKTIAIKKAVNEARMVASMCKSAADSFRHRRDMLIQKSFNSREERKGELRTYEQASRDARNSRVEDFRNQLSS